MILEKSCLDEEDLLELGFTLKPFEPDLSEEALKWIETAAYYIWADEGFPEGRHIEHWDRAYQLYYSR